MIITGKKSILLSTVRATLDFWLCDAKHFSSADNSKLALMKIWMQNWVRRTQMSIECLFLPFSAFEKIEFGQKFKMLINKTENKLWNGTTKECFWYHFIQLTVDYDLFFRPLFVSEQKHEKNTRKNEMREEDKTQCATKSDNRWPFFFVLQFSIVHFVTQFHLFVNHQPTISNCVRWINRFFFLLSLQIQQFQCVNFN